MLEKESEVDSLKKVMKIQQQQMEQLLGQFEDLKIIKQKEKLIEARQAEMQSINIQRDTQNMSA